jgi:hypothetical protein
MFKRLWKIVKCWNSFRYATNGYLVYKTFVEGNSQLLLKLE